MRWSIHTENPTKREWLSVALSAARDAELGVGMAPTISAKLNDIDAALETLPAGAARSALEAARTELVAVAAGAPGIKDEASRTEVAMQMNAAIAAAQAAVDAAGSDLPVNVSLSGASERQDDAVSARLSIFVDFIKPTGKPAKEPTPPKGDPLLSGAASMPDLPPSRTSDA